MKQRVKLILVLMSVCTLCLLVFQFYWSYQAFQSASKTFRNDINQALQGAVNKEMEHRQDEIADAYKRWLSDTSLIVINCHIDTTSGLTVFTVADKESSKNSKSTFSIGFQDYKHEGAKMTPKVKKYFIDRLVGTEIRQNLQHGDTFYYTRQLGELMEDALLKSKLNAARLHLYYKKELSARGINTDFQLHHANEKLAASEDFPFATHTFSVGFKKPFDEVKAYFPDPNKTLLLRMKWVLLSSFILMAVTICCFAYTVLTILRQKKLSELKNDFINNMTHELRTPVATISVAAEAIQDFNLSKTSADEYLAIIRQQSGRLSQLIDGILKNLAFEQDQLDLEPRLLNMKLLVQQAILQHKPQLDKAGARVTIDFPEHEILVMADELHLLNVLSNLIENALKYSHGWLHLQLQGREENGQVVLALKDNGMGIPAIMQAKVFEKFFRVPSGNMHNTKGYGLGLSYAKTIMERHGGTICLLSQVQQGSTFILSLPTCQHEPAPDTVT